MQFQLVDHRFKVRSSALPCVILVRDTWNDFFEFHTQFRAFYAPDDRQEHILLGDVKILQKGVNVTSPPETFTQIGESYG